MIPKVIHQYDNLLFMTEQLLYEHSEISQENECVFARWSHVNEVEDRYISRYTTYFQDIREVRLDLFHRRVYDTLKTKLVSLLSSM